MSYYATRRYNPPADLYRTSTLIGQHTGKNAWTPLAQNPVLDAELQQFRSDRSRGPAADAVRERLDIK